MEENQQSAVADSAEATGETNHDAVAPAETVNAIADLTREKAELQDRLLRLTAEFDNFRKRSERDRADFAVYAGEQVVRAMLPILDDFERALKLAPQNDEFVRGIELIYNRLLETLKKQGLEPIEAEGQQFDPHRHEAIQRLESDDHEDGTVVQEFQRGYDFKGKLLRPSMVQVAVKP